MEHIAIDRTNTNNTNGGKNLEANQELPQPDELQLVSPSFVGPGFIQRRVAKPDRLTADDVRHLQSTIGNRAVQRLLATRRNENSNPTSAQPPIARKTNPSSPIPGEVQTKMETAFDTDFSDVNIHPDSQAASNLKALAYTQGNHIHFAPGQFSPDTEAGQKLIGHELAHVVQQRQGLVNPTHLLGKNLPVNAEPELEQAADVMGAEAAKGNKVQAHPNGLTYLLPVRKEAVIQGVFTQPTLVELEKTGVTAQTKEAKDFEIGAITLPQTLRPPTQFGNKQMAHSISWTLLKQAYVAAKGKNLADFIDHYFKKDWAALEEQGKLKGRNINSEFEGYLKTYPTDNFDSWKTLKLSSFEWHKKMQTAITNFFVALQLAPLSTHTGFQLEKGKASEGIKETNPSGHGEPQANKFLLEVERVLTDTTILDKDTALDKLRSKKDQLVGVTVKAAILKKAAAYWDIGINKEGGIEEEAEIKLLKDKFTVMFSRAYPKIWAIYKGDITSGVLTGKITVAEEEEEGLEKETVAEKEATGEAEEGAGEETVSKDDFIVQLMLKEVGADKEGSEATEYKVKSIGVSADRIPTKYGPIGQKSHTVALTLVLQSLRNEGKDKNLKMFLQILLSKWLNIQAQDWATMIKDELIGTGDFKEPAKMSKGDKKDALNAQNRIRLKQVQALIDPNIARITEALSGAKKADLDWTYFVQETLSDYVVVYQSAPLTSHKKKPGGRGESDANLKLSVLEEDLAAKVPNSNNTPTKVVELVLKYIDINWGTGFVNSPIEMAKAHYEWEESLRVVYPEIWTKYSPEILKASNAKTITPLKLAEGASAKGEEVAELEPQYSTMEGWMDDERSHQGLVSIRTGNEEQGGSAAFNKAKDDYKLGLASIQTGNIDEDESAAFNAAKQDYEKGQADIQGGDKSRGTAPAYNAAKTDYKTGLSEGSGIMLDAPRLAANPAYVEGFKVGRKQLGYSEGNQPLVAQLPDDVEYMQGFRAAPYQHGLRDANDITILNPQSPDLNYLRAYNQSRYDMGYRDGNQGLSVSQQFPGDFEYVRGYTEGEQGKMRKSRLGRKASSSNLVLVGNDPKSQKEI